MQGQWARRKNKAGPGQARGFVGSPRWKGGKVSEPRVETRPWAEMGGKPEEGPEGVKEGELVGARG